MHVDLGGYHVRDIEFTAAFDIDGEKVGKDLGQAIWAGQNNTIAFAKVPKHLGVTVHRGMTHDGLGKYLSQKITKAPGETADIVRILKDTRTDVVVSYLPVGSEQATKWYVEQVLEAGCGFVNCVPVFIGPSDYVPWLTDRKWAHIRVEGQAFGDVPLNLELKLEVWDSPNSAGIVIDAVRCCKLALNHGIGGQLDGPSAYLMKSPRNQRPDEQARVDTEKFIARYAGRAPGSVARRPTPPTRAARAAA